MTSVRPGAYDLYAELLDYPQPDLARTAERAGLRELAEWAAGLDSREVEEVYTRTFDLHAPCCLEVGWHLFGETYRRGGFLVKLTVACREHGVAPGTELADHLSVLLRLVSRLGDDEDPRGLVEEAILPAIDKMIAALDGAGAGAANPYRALLAAVDARLRGDHRISRAEPAPGAARHLPLYAYPEVER
jgi:nitrate reductase delta subunit